jgi:Flp pilus assembly protein TadB
VIALLAALFVAGGMVLIAWGIASREQAGRQSLVQMLDLERVDPTQSPQTLVALMERAGALADRAFKDTATSSKLQASLASGGVKLRTGEFAVVSAGVGVLGALGALVFFSPLVSLVFLVGLPLATYFWVIRKGKKRRIALENQLPTVLQLLAGSLDSGASMLHAMEIVAQEGNAPLAEEFARVRAETQVGRPLLDSLQAMSDRCASQDLDWTVEAIRIQYTSGGSLSETLRTLAEFMRARVEIRAEVRALSAEARLSGKVLTGLPLLVGGFLMLFRPDYVAPLYQTGTGKMMLVAAGFGMLMGTLWMQRIIKKVEV